MAGKRFLVDTLVSLVKLVESIPTSQNAFSDEDIADLLSMELQSTIVPLLMDVREEFFVVSRDYNLSNGTNELYMPTDAVGVKLRDVTWVDSSGTVQNIPRLSPEQIAAAGTGSWISSGVGGFSGFYIQGNTIQLYPKNQNVATSVRITYFKRVNDLVLSNQGGTVLSVVGNVVTLDNVPPEWTTNFTFDAIQGSTPFNFAVNQADLSSYQHLGRSDPTLTDFSVTGISGFDLVVDPAIASSFAPGQLITESGYAFVSQFIPQEAYPLLVQSAAKRCLEAMGDREGYANADVKYKRMEKDLLGLIDNRVEGESKKAVAFNSLAKASRRRWPMSRL